MTEQTRAAVDVPDPTPQAVAELLEVVAAHSMDHALSDMEQALVRLRIDVEEATEARQLLRNTPAVVLREALRLRAARTQKLR